MNSLDSPLFAVLVTFFTILSLLCLDSFLKIAPDLWKCATRWKTNVEFENSNQLARSRNLVAVVAFIPFCIFSYKFGFLCPEFLTTINPVYGFLGLTGLFTAYLILRGFLNWQIEVGGYHGKEYAAANKSFFNFAIILFLMFIFIGTIGSAIPSLPKDVLKKIINIVAGASYLLFIHNRFQIFASVCNPLTTFLYLCGLEIIPTGALITVVVLL